MILEDIGNLIAISGSAISVIGNIANTIWKKHQAAILLWTISSFLNSLWFLGFLDHWWNGGIGAAAMLGMNLVFLVTNLWGLRNVR